MLLESVFISKPLNLTDVIFYFQCFTRGFEYKKHRSDHRYEIMVSVLSMLFGFFFKMSLTAHLILNFFAMETDLRLPCARAWMDGTGRDGSIGGSHGLWLWKLVSDLKNGLLAEQTGMTTVFGFF